MRLIRTPEWFQAPETRYPNLSSVVRRAFTSVQEAEAFARSLGVQGIDYEGQLDLANLANEFLSQLQDRNLNLPLTISVHPRLFEARFPNDLPRIAALGESGAIFLNPIAFFWNDVLSATRLFYATRFWSTPSPLHVFVHEYAHLSQSEQTRQRKLTPRQVTLADAVSIRAMFNTEEFLCEVYPGLFEGVEYDRDILRSYHALGGRKP